MTYQHKPYLSYKLALIAGLIGGAIEIIWLLFLSQLTPIDLLEVGRQTSLNYYLFLRSSTWLIPVGISIHAVISIVVGLAFSYIINKSPSTLHKTIFIPVLAIGFLLFIWIMNFTFILSIIKPRFLSIIPFTVTLMCKILFGCGMGLTFLWVKESQTTRINKLGKQFKHKNRSTFIFPLI